MTEQLDRITARPEAPNRYDIPFMFPRAEGQPWAAQAHREGAALGVSPGCSLGLHRLCKDLAFACRCVCHGPDEEWE